MESTQAGEQITCRCGACLDVPTLKTLTRLKTLGPPTAAEGEGAGTWAARQRILLLGAILVVIAILMGSWLFATRPRMFRAHPPAAALPELWAHLRQGLEQSFPGERDYLARTKDYWRWMLVVGAGGLAGLLTMASSLLVGRQDQGPHRLNGGEADRSSRPG